MSEHTYTGETRHARIIDSQTGPFLRELVRLVRPQVVVECGTFPGTATQFIAEGLTSGGTLRTYERDLKLYPEMAALFAGNAWVVPILGAPESFEDANLAFIDSGPSYEDRIADVHCWWATAPPGAIAVIDDTNEEWYGSVRALGLDLPSEHGMVIWQKPAL